MFRLPFNLKGGKGEVVAIADIGSASASVAIMRRGTLGNPSAILAAERVSLPMEKRAQERSATLVIQALAEAAQKALAAYGMSGSHVRPVKLYAIIHAPWAQTNMLEGREAFDREKSITDAYVISSARNMLAQSRSLDADAPLEAHIAKVELNGYPTRAPEHKHARSMHIALLTSDIPSDFRSAAENALGLSFPGLPVEWRSHTHALLALLHNLPPFARNYFTVDVSAEDMSLMTIRKGILEAHASIPEGTVSILGKISSDTLPEEALTMMRAVENDVCNTEQCKRMAGALAKTEQWLTRIIGEQLARMAAVRNLPNMLFLLAHPDLSPWLARFFARIDFAQFTTTTLPFSVVALTMKDFSSMVVSEHTTLDTSLSLACALVHTEVSH